MKKASLIKIFLYTLLFVVMINYGWIFAGDLQAGTINLYNKLYPGRERLPFGENPENSYNLSILDIGAAVASHRINSTDIEKTKVFVFGDSSIWGYLQDNQDTLAGILQEEFNEGFDGKQVEILNFGYPSISVLKDLMLIDQTLRYDPDLILWFTTLEALPVEKQLEVPLIENNASIVNQLIQKYGLTYYSEIPVNRNDHTLIKRRKHVADLLRYQIYGFLWGATGIDQFIPEQISPARRDFEDLDLSFHGMQTGSLLDNYLDFNLIKMALQENHERKIILINEPILISEGKNSEERYNYYYPKWAYDQYRTIFNQFCHENTVECYDFWNLVPESEFTNSAIHLTLDGEKLLANEIYQIIQHHLK